MNLKKMRFSDKYYMVDIDEDIIFLPTFYVKSINPQIRSVSNSSGKTIIRMIAEGRTNSDILDTLYAKYNESEDVIEADFNSFIDNLIELGVLVNE